MKKIILILPFLFLFIALRLAAQESSDTQLAFEYFKNKEYDKASVLYKKLYDSSNSKIYFSYYLKCLIELQKFDDAEKFVKKSIKSNANDPTFLVELGFIYKSQNNVDKATEYYDMALKKIPADDMQVRQLANAYISKLEYDYAEKVYINAADGIGNSYHYDLASLYFMQRNLSKMVEEYLEVLNENPSFLTSVENSMQYLISQDTDDNLQKILKTGLLKRIQGSKAKEIYYEMLIWLYVQEKNFAQAFVQERALDRRNNTNGERIIELGNLALSNDSFAIAETAFQYVIDKGSQQQNYVSGKLGLLSVLYKKVVSGGVQTPDEIANLEKNYLNVINEFGKVKTISLIKDLAHIQAFYLNKSKEAMELLESTVTNNQLPTFLRGDCQMELADIQMITGDVWEATLTYAKVEKSNENNPLGSEAKFRKAKLAYYTGNFKWAQAQLDGLKASTSKLISNDAIELSLLISENIDDPVDSANTSLKMYANAELLLLQNQDSLALLTLDSIVKIFPTHPLVDEVYFKKYKIYYRQGLYKQSADYLMKIITTYSTDILGDVSQFELAKLYEYKLNDKARAMELYKELMVKYPGSLYVEDARKHFRALRGDVQ